MCSLILTGLNNIKLTTRLVNINRSSLRPFKLSSSYLSEEKREENTTSTDDASVSSSEETIKKLQEENSNLLERVKEIDDKFKRALAEGENTRVRMRKQIDEAKAFGIQGFCKDLLEVADVLEKALDSVPNDQLQSNSSLKELFTGVKMTNDQLQSIFRRHGLVKINPIGEKFNPNDHHAMFEAIIPGKEPGTVSVVTQIGYKLKDRTIRPAMVGVVKAAE